LTATVSTLGAMPRTRSSDHDAGVAAVDVNRADVLRFRLHRHGLHHEPASLAEPTDVDLLDYGVQDTGPDGAAWALAIRGADIRQLDDRFLLAWTLRGAPHAYRLDDAPHIALATAPFSEADAAKRVFDAAKPLKAADIPVLDALATVATQQRKITTKSIVKGDLSTELTGRLDEPFLRWCRPCNATHLYEQPFRLSPLQAGLALQPNTSPPVLRRVRGLKPLAFSRSGADAEPGFHVVRNHLRFYGPTTPNDVAGFLDSPVADLKRHWPTDVSEVTVKGFPGGRHVLAEDLDALTDPPSSDPFVRLLGPYDPYLQLRDRDLLVRDEARRKDLWRVLGRPGAVVDHHGEIVATWRPRSSGRRLTVTVDPWTKLTKATRARIDDEAERLAQHRDAKLRGVEVA
jgi:hypothetical protein